MLRITLTRRGWGDHQEKGEPCRSAPVKGEIPEKPVREGLSQCPRKNGAQHFLHELVGAKGQQVKEQKEHDSGRNQPRLPG